MLTGILQCIVLSHFNTGQTHFTNRMLTGILQCIVLPLFITDQPILSTECWQVYCCMLFYLFVTTGQKTHFYPFLLH